MRNEILVALSVFILLLMILVSCRYGYALRKTFSLIVSPPYPSSLIQKVMEHGLAPTLNQAVKDNGGYVALKMPCDNLQGSTIVTNHLREFPPDKFHKKGGVPSLLMDIAQLTPKGESVFIQNLSDRGPENRRKVEYMSALTHPHLVQHRATIRRVLCNPCESMTLLDRVLEITWRLHFGKSPCPQAVEFFHSFRCAFSDISLHGIWTCRQDFILKKPFYVEFLRVEMQEASCDSIVGVWKSRGFFSEEDMIVEFSHNILAMTMQWFLLSREALKDRALASSDSSTFFDKHGFAPSIVSLNNNGQRIVAQIAPSAPSKCPYRSSNSSTRRTTIYDKDLEELAGGEIVPRGEVINIAPEHLAFGKGYRRCAGEVLNYIYLEELLRSPVEFRDPDLGNIPWAFTRAR